MTRLLQDLRYALRRLIKLPGFTVVIVVSVALGIGAITMMFSLFNVVLLRPLSYPDPNRLVILWFTPPDQPDELNFATVGNCWALTEGNSVFEYTGCFRAIEGVFSDDDPGGNGAEVLRGEAFSYGVQQAIGVRPSIGRWFTEDEDREGADRVVMISYALWQSRFGGSSDVIGKQVRVTDVRSSDLLSTIIGVMPAGFTFTNTQADYWVPLRLPASTRTSNSTNRAGFLPVARLKPGITVVQAQSAMDALALRFEEELPSNEGWGIRVERFREAFIADLRQAFLILQLVAALVLLIACANVGGLLLAQGISQKKEIAVRAALGSTRSRIVRLWLTLSLVLSVLGGVLGLAFAWGGLSVLVSYLPPIPGLARLNEASIDPTVFIFTLLVSVAAGLLFGILPALQVSRPDIADAVKESGRGSTSGASRQRLRSLFVVVQLSLATLLLIGAALMINSFVRLYTVEVGLDPDDIMTFQIQFGGNQFKRYTGNTGPNRQPETEFSERLNIISEQIRQGLASTRGIESATAIALTPPLSGGARYHEFTIEGRPASLSESEAQGAEMFAVMSDYIPTLRIPLLRGRDFSDRDTATSIPVMLINRTMAQRFFPNEDPIGKRMQLDYVNDEPRQVIGIVGDIRQNSRDQNYQPQMYVPYAQLPLVTSSGTRFDRIVFLVRYVGSPNELAPTLRSAVAAVDSTQARAAANFRPLEQYVLDQLQGYWQYVLLLSLFAAIALVLAMFGVYGMMAHSVNERRSELGIRMALGATPWQIIRLLLRRGVVLIFTGLVVGLGSSFALSRVIQNRLWGIEATDPFTFVFVSILLSGTALIACYLPARRALRVDPVATLRADW